MQHGADAHELDSHTDPRDIDRRRVALQPFNLDQVSDPAAIDAADLLDLASAARDAGQIAAISATGVRFNRHAVVAEWLRWVLLAITGSLDQPGGMPFDPGITSRKEDRPAWSPSPPAQADGNPATRPDLWRQFGQHPCVAMVDEIEAGILRGLIVSGGRPLTAFPNPTRTRAALESLDLLVVLDVVESELTSLATHVLPVAAQLKRTDLSRQTRGMFIPAVVRPAAQRAPEWWIGARLGVDVVDGLDVAHDRTSDAVVHRVAAATRWGRDALAAAGPRGLDMPTPIGWVHQHVLPDARWRLAPEVLLERLPGILDSPDRERLLLTSRRDMRNTHAVKYAAKADQPSLRLHRCDMARLSVSDGQPVHVRSSVGQLIAVARSDANYRPGVVGLAHGCLEPNVGALVDGANDIDPLTGQPVMTGIVITIDPIL